MPAVETPAAADAALPASDPAEQIRKLAELQEAGVLTPAEFDAAKERILGSL